MNKPSACLVLMSEGHITSNAAQLYLKLKPLAPPPVEPLPPAKRLPLHLRHNSSSVKCKATVSQQYVVQSPMLATCKRCLQLALLEMRANQLLEAKR